MQNKDKNFFTSGTGIIIMILLVLCCLCLFILIGGTLGGMYYLTDQPTPSVDVVTSTPVETTPFTSTFKDATPTPFEITKVPVENIPNDTLTALQNSVVPENDPYDIACRLEGKCNIPSTLPSGPFKVGDKQSFWLTNPDDFSNFQVPATLKYITEHSYFWVQDGVPYKQNQAKKLMDTFETKIYPTDREFFGSEWTPGVDGDPHIYVLYARGIGKHVGGYFSPQDEYHPDAHQDSNAHEMFVFNADNSLLSAPYTYGTLAHEFQHMIHWKQDLNESGWLNEGFSELAAFLNNYTVGSVPIEFIADPDLQLTDWNQQQGTNGPHYGASFLFVTYFLDRFGEEATKALVRDPQNGMESIDEVLKSINAVDKLTGKPIQADDVFMDWAAANYLQDGSVGDGRYIYHNYLRAPQASDTETISDCPTTLSSSVHQYGTDYIHFNCIGTHILQFEGATTTRLIPEDAYSGKMAFWSNKGDLSDMTLTHEFDFTNVSGPLTLSYQAWYDIEKDYDYTYLEASSDGGKSWQFLNTPSGTGDNPTGGSYGWGYTGKSNGWIKESVDLSQFKGKKIMLRFEYITDGAMNGEGFMLDDVSIPEINYATDFEKDDGGWQNEGFVRVENLLAQKFRLLLINNNGTTDIKTIDLSPDQTAEINVDLSDATLVVSGVTRFTREEANYTVTVK